MQSVLSENFQFLEVKFSIYLNRRVFVMDKNFTYKLYLTARELRRSLGIALDFYIWERVRLAHKPTIPI